MSDGSKNFVDKGVLADTFIVSTPPAPSSSPLNECDEKPKQAS